MELVIRRAGQKAILLGCLATAGSTLAQMPDSTVVMVAPEPSSTPTETLATADSAAPALSLPLLDSTPARGAAPDTTFTDSVAPGVADLAEPARDSAEPTAAPSTEAGSKDSADLPRSQTGRSVGATVTIKGVARHKRKEVSTSQLRREEFKKVAATAQDPLRALPTLPGVTVASDLSVRPVVRGGDLTETGVQLDGTPLLMPYHFGSVFSVFHREALDDFQLHSGVAPAEAEGMLSGSVLATTRPAPMDTLFGGVDLSLLRGSAWVGVPVVKDKVGLWLSAQSLWYDWVIKRGMDVGRLMGAFDAKEVDEYQSMVTLPTTWDVQTGLSWRLDRNWLLDIGGFAAGDKYQIREQIEVCTQDGKEVPCSGRQERWDPGQDRYVETCYEVLTEKWVDCAGFGSGKTIDTVAEVGLSNWLARARLSWSPDRDLALEGVASFQALDWDVRFPGNRELVYDSTKARWSVTRTSDSSAFDWRRSLADLELSGRKRWSESQETRFGIGWGREGETVLTRLERPAALLILGTSGNPLEFLGLYPESERVFLADQGSYRALDDFAGFEFDYRSDTTLHRWHAWGEQRWDPDAATRVRLGVRLSEDLDGGMQIPNPRVQVQRQWGERDLVGIGLGLHTQSELPFEWRLTAQTPLVAEKAWLGIAEWEHTFAPGWRSTLSGWGKLYRDLASASVRKSGTVDSNALYQDLIDWTFGESTIPDSLRRILEGMGTSVSEFRQALWSAVPDSVVRAYTDLNTSRHLVYASTGEGWAAGIEASLRYQPTPGWTGWASAEWSVSRRQDRQGGVWYPFGLERPWKLSWVNAFRIDRKWEVSARYLAQAGNPYTPFRYGGDILGGSTTGDTLLWIGKRNAAQLAPYQRLDLRISRESRMFGKPATFYYEIWNAFNDPNFILRDSKTGEFRMVQLNVPFPTIFLGVEVRF